MNDEHKFVGALPLCAVTPEMLTDPRLMLASPLFVKAEDMADKQLAPLICPHCQFEFCECGEYD